jgi:hypothetical protein
VPLPSRAAIERRVRTCARLFLDGCRTTVPKAGKR